MMYDVYMIYIIYDIYIYIYIYIYIERERERENRVEQEESFRKRQYVETYKKCRFYLFRFLDYQINYYEV